MSPAVLLRLWVMPSERLVMLPTVLSERSETSPMVTWVERLVMLPEASARPLAVSLKLLAMSPVVLRELLVMPPEPLATLLALSRMLPEASVIPPAVSLAA